MKYVIILGDGMADYPNDKGNTPLSSAHKPTIDALAARAEVGLVKTIPDGFKPGSDTANLSVLGYAPERYYTGRSPLEAYSLGIVMADDDLAIRCNLVTVSEDEPYESKTMIDYSSGEITPSEAATLMADVARELNTDTLHFYTGFSYRHCLIVNHGTAGTELTPPHDITGKKIAGHLPTGVYGEQFLDLYKRSYKILNNHLINQKRRAKGLNAANSIWFWGEGSKPAIDSFYGRYGIRGAIISAVDLLKGIGKAAGMEVPEIEGATGTIETNYKGKVSAALNALKSADFCYIHIEAPDECGHQGNFEGKTRAIGLIDSEVVKPMLDGLTAAGEDFRLLVLPDHPTPICTKTHASDPVPYLLYQSNATLGKYPRYDEKTAKSGGVFRASGVELMTALLQK